MSKMQPRDLVLAVVGELGDREDFGRTSLQKVTYLASLVLGIELGHHAYYYGPYSTAVESDAEALVLGGLVDETIQPLGFTNKGFAVRQYRYAITNAGRERLKRVAAAHEEEVNRLRAFVRQIVVVVGSIDQQTLSAAAKTLYITRDQGRPVSTEEVKTLAKDVGWQLTTVKIRRVAEMLNQLDLVELVES